MMKPTTALLAMRPGASIVAPPSLRSFFLARAYATQHGLGTTAAPGPKRRGVTPFNDDGYVPWNELSAGEKAARATQQSFNFGMIIVGLVLTVWPLTTPGAQPCIRSCSDRYIGRCWVPSVDGRLLPR